jgi:hypothetical protein
MEKLRIIDNGIEKFIDYTEKVAKGIFMVSENKFVQKNCQILNIELGENTHPNELKQKVTKLDKTGIMTTRVLNQHFMYIFKDYADPLDVDAFINEFPEHGREALKMAYASCKI